VRIGAYGVMLTLGGVAIGLVGALAGAGPGA